MIKVYCFQINILFVKCDATQVFVKAFKLRLPNLSVKVKGGIAEWPTKWHKLTPNRNFESLYIYYIPHDYTIPQVMPHSIPQTHCVFDPQHIIISMKKKTKTKQTIEGQQSGKYFGKAFLLRYIRAKIFGKVELLLLLCYKSELNY